ncbi:MAG: SMP-30/gluconolactonase/LRE family protein [Verrucomicrobiota bacterium]
MNLRITSSAFAAVAFISCAFAAEPDHIEPDTNILFLGDSITQSGGYIAYIQTYLWREFPDQNYHIINLGLGSETASGLSEPDHPFPRPCIHSRLDRALAEAKPDLTFICYGMNDGIYYPPSDEQQKAFQDGMTKLIEKVRAVGSEVIVMTPPPFDAETYRLRDRPLLKAGEPEYSYKVPYENYDGVLEQFGDWVMQLKDGVELTIDLHTPLKEMVAGLRADDPSYQFGDGIHPNAAGHRLMAETILKALNAPNPDQIPADDEAVMKIVKQRHNLISASWREHVGHDKPGKSKALSLDEGKAKAAELEAEIRKMLAPSAAILDESFGVQKVAEGCEFTEGPTIGPDGALVFSDSPNNRVMRLSPDGQLTEWIQPSGAANGLLFDHEGRLLMCQSSREGGGRALARRNVDGTIETLTSHYNDKRYIAPNDVCIDAKGRIYFTDPYYSGEKSQPTAGIYRYDPDGDVELLVTDLLKPNGIVITPDGKTIYVRCMASV